MYKACLSKGGFEEEAIPSNAMQKTLAGKKDLPDGQKRGEEEKLVLEPLDIKEMEEDERGEEEEPDKSVKLTIKHFKERAQQYAKTHFDEHVKK
jgi:hypothetical protein